MQVFVFELHGPLKKSSTSDWMSAESCPGLTVLSQSNTTEDINYL